MLEVDWSGGQIMQALKDQNIEENTLVIFTSDNGPWRSFGNHAGNTGGLREGKGTTFEGGQREPCIMRWPGKIPAGTICNKLSSTIDLLPTCAELTGVKKPAHKIDGVSILPLLMNDASANPRDELVYYYHKNSLEALRKGQWKLVFPHTTTTYIGGPPGKDGFPHSLPRVKVGMALYDLSIDPGETVDVQSSYPEKVEELKKVADKYRADLGDDLTGVKCTGCRPPATYQPSAPVPAAFR